MKNILLALVIGAALVSCKTMTEAMTGMKTGFVGSFDPVPYKPSGKTQFYFEEKGVPLQKYGYGSFCEDISYNYCDQELEYDTYVGMKGYFESDKALKKGSYYYFPVVLENGLRIYYKNRKQERFSSLSGFKPLILGNTDIARSYEPEGKELYVLNNTSTKYHDVYNSLCFEQFAYSCDSDALVNIERYNEMKAYFIMDEPVISSLGSKTYILMLESGRKIFYKEDGGRSSGEIIPLAQWEAENQKLNEPLVKGSDVIIENKKVKGTSVTYRLNTGQTITQKELDTIRDFQAKYGKSPKLAGFLVGKEIKYDQVENRYFIQGDLGYKDAVEIYVGKKGGVKWMRFKITYYDDDWIFAKSFKVAADDYRWQSPGVTFERDNGSGSVWEWFDTRATPHYVAVAKRLANASSSIVRLQGSQYYSDYELTKKEKQNIKDMLSIYSFIK